MKVGEFNTGSRSSEGNIRFLQEKWSHKGVNTYIDTIRRLSS